MNNSEIYREFLGLLDVTDVERELPFLIKACSRYQIKEETMFRCVREHLPRYFHMELRGVRTLLRLYVTEWIGLEKLWERNVIKIYYNVPGTPTGMYWLARSLKQAGYDTAVCTPDLITMIVLYGIIGMEEKIAGLNGCRHCAVNMMREYLTIRQIIPKPDIRWSFGLLCDEAPKKDMILEYAEEDALHVFIQKPSKHGDCKAYLEQQLEKGIRETEKRYGITCEKEGYQLEKKKRFSLAMRIDQIIRFLNRSEAFVIGNEEVGLIETLILASFQMDPDEISDILARLLEEMKEYAAGQNCPRMQYRYAVYYTPVCNPLYGSIMEKNGIGLLHHTAFVSTAVVMQGDHPAEDMAYECMGMLIGKDVDQEAEKISEIIIKNRLDGLVLGMFAFDRWMGAQQIMLQQKVEEQTGKHVLVYETDFWNQDSFSGDRMEMAMETVVSARGRGKSAE